jgi:hypothetical protein
VVAQNLRDAKHTVRAKNPRPSSVDEDKILFLHDLVSMVNATVQLLAKSQKRSGQLHKLVNKKNEMLVMVGASLRQQTAQVAGHRTRLPELRPKQCLVALLTCILCC